MKVSTVARQTIAAAAFSITRNQIGALLILFTLLMPIAAPIPAWAYDLNLPAEPKESLAGFGSMASVAEISSSIKARVIDSVSGLFDESGDDVRKTLAGAKVERNEENKDIPDESTAEDDALIERKLSSGEKDVVQDEGEDAIDPGQGEQPAPTALLVIGDDDTQVIRESSYSGANNIGSPAGQFEADAPNEARATRIKHRAGVANFSFDVPIASLPGRGLSASIGMAYNSRTWNRSQVGSATTYTHNVDKNWIAPGFTMGYGSLTSHFVGKVIRMNNGDLKTYNEVVPDGYTDIDGTRHQLECRTRVRIAGTETASTAGVDNYYCPDYATKDGTFVKALNHGYSTITAYQQPNKSNYTLATFTLIHSDGTRVSYSVPGSQFGANDYTRDHYPMMIQDSNGNQVNISYLNGTNKIQTITDTLGREMKFYYENPTGSDPKLVAVTVPGFGTSGERQTIRFYYEDNVALTHQGRFDGTVVAPNTYRALRYVYFPATQSGYRYDYEGLGMIGKITKLMGMTVSTTALNSTGTVTSNDVATTAATTQYNYVSDGSTTPLTNVPKFNLRTDVWRGPAGNQTSTTGYDSSDPGGSSDVTTTVTVSEGTHSVEYQTIANSAGYTTETSVTEKGPNQFPKVMSKKKYFWDIKPTGNFGGAYFTWLKKIEATNDANQTRATEFDVDDYNNTKLVRECEIAAPGSQCTELRSTETSYVTGANWINNQLLRLPETVTIKVGSTAVSKTVFAYDESSQLQETPGVVHHDPAYNPNQGTHTEWHWECDGQPSPPRCPDGTDADHVQVEVPNADPRYYYRGNVTKVTSFSDATLPSDSNANVRTMEYDMTGNIIKVHGMSCCNVKAIEYTSATQYAYPTKETKGLATQLETSVVYDVNTGLIIRSEDENDQPTVYSYDPNTLRQTRVDYPNGSWVTSDINDTQFPYHIKTTSSLDSDRSVSSWSFFDGAGLGFRSRSLRQAATSRVTWNSIPPEELSAHSIPTRLPSWIACVRATQNSAKRVSSMD